MRIIFFILFTLLFAIYCKSQYIRSENKNTYFNQIIRNQNNSKNIFNFFYNQKLEDYSYWTGVKYNPKFLGSKTNNILTNNHDSITIIDYIIKYDSTIFNCNKLIEFVKENKMVAYNYAFPNIKYDNKNIDSIVYLSDDICKEFSDHNCTEIKIKNLDSTETIYKVETKINTNNINDFEVYLEIKRQKNKLKIKIKAIIVYDAYYDSSTGDFRGLAGLCCFVFKN